MLTVFHPSGFLLSSGHTNWPVVRSETKNNQLSTFPQKIGFAYLILAEFEPSGSILWPLRLFDPIKLYQQDATTVDGLEHHSGAYAL